MKSFFNYAKNRILYNLFRFLFFVIVALILLSSKVNALETDFKALEVIGYNNNGNSLTMGEQFYCDMSNGNCSMYLTTLANSYGGAWGIQSPIPLLETHTYSISLEMRSPNSGLTLSSKSNISIGTTMDNARNNYVNSYFNTDILTSSVHNNIIQYAFKANSNANYLIIPFTTFENTYSIFYIDKLIIDDLGYEGVSQGDINNSLNNQTTIINGSIQNSTNSINDNINDMEDSINNNIKDNFNTCRDSYNLIDLSQFNTITNNGLTFTKTEDGVIVINGTVTATFGLSLTHVTLSPGEYSMASYSYENVYLFKYNTLTTFLESGQTKYLDSSTTFGVDMYFSEVGKVYDNVVIKPMLNIGSPKSFEPFGEICSNKIDQTNDKLDEANKTSKGIWDTLKNLPKTILDGFLDLLLKVFVPEDDFFSNWFNEVKSMFEEQLGFLATPFTIIIEFVERFLELNSSTDIIINIPDITVPNFENITLINATSFNWSSLLNSKDSLKNLWTLYLDFIDVFLILNFIGLCSSIYGRIFGGDTSNFEYYTVEDTYTVNDSTGEVTNHRLNQRKTTRKKVN